MKSKLFLLNKESRKGSLSLDETRMQPGSDQEGSSRKWYKQVATLLLLLLTLCIGNAWGAAGDEITSTANIVSGKTYFIKGVRSSTTYYLTFTDATGSQSGTESSTKAGAVPITFTQVSGGWNLTTPSGNYIAPGTDNGKINVSSSAILVSASNQSSKIRLSITSGGNTWSLQKNTGAANFGGYKNTQTDITLIEAATYTVGWSVNGSACSGSPSTSAVEGHVVAVLPTAPTSSNCDGSKAFVGWSASAIDGTTNTKPSDLFSTAGTAPAVTGNVTYYAVFATSGSATKTFEWTLSYTDFSTSSYAANDGDHSSTATATDASGVTCDIDWTSSNVMQSSSKIQFKGSPKGYLYNTTDLGTINSVSYSSGSNITTYQNSSSHPSSNGTPKQYLTAISNGSTATATSMTVNFTKTVTVYSDYATSCAACTQYEIAYGIDTGEGSDPTGTELACEGATVSFTPAPADGYEYGGARVLDEDDNVIATLDANTTSFTMDDKDAYVYVTYRPRTYTITLDNQSATSAGTTTISVTYGANTNLTGTPAITVPTKTGYTFGGYYTATEGGGGQVIDASGNVIAVADNGSEFLTDENKKWIYADDITLYAKWTINNYTVNWIANGTTWTGVSHGSPSTGANYNTKVTTIPTAPQSSNCDNSKVFVGWTKGTYSHATDAPTILFTTQAGSPEITESTIFYAVFATASEGGEVSWDLVKSTSSLANDDIITFTSTCSYNVTGVTYYDTVAYAGKSGADAGLGAIASIGITSDKIREVKSGTIREIKLETGSAANTWNLYDNTDKYITKGTAKNKIAYSASPQDISLSIADGTYIATVTLATDSTFRYNPNSGSGRFSKYKYDASGTKDIQIYKKSGGIVYSDYVTTCCTSWDDPTVAYASTTIATGGSATAAPTITGTTHGTLSFSSDNTSVATVNSSTGAVTPSASCPGTANITAHWTAADGYCEKDVVVPFTVTGDVTITFNANGGTGSMSSQVISYNTATALNANTFTHATKTFGSWNTAADGSGTRYTDGQSVQLTTNVTLYAQWLVLYTITFDNTNGPDVASVKQTTEGGKVTLPTASPSDACVDEGWAFVGWKNGSAQSSTSSLPDGLIPAGKYTPEGSATFYAVYKLRSGGTDKTDELTNTLIDAGNSYGEWSDISATNSGHSNAVYAGLSAGGNSAIQLRGKNNSGIITTTSGGIATKVVVTWNENTEDGRIIQVYGKNSAYSATSDLYANATHGTLLGTIVKGTSTTLNIASDSTYIGIRSKENALYADKIEVMWSAGGTTTYKSAPDCAACENNPTVSAAGKGEIGSTTAIVTCAGITDLGTKGEGSCTITSYGYCWGKSTTPNLSSEHYELGTSYTVTGTVFANYTITGLTPNTTYYVRPYATNGHGTAYGAATSFTTEDAAYITFMVPNGVDAPSPVVLDEDLPVADVPTDCGNCWVFAGWITSSSYDSSTAPAKIYKAGESAEDQGIASSQTLYALYTRDFYRMLDYCSQLSTDDSKNFYVLSVYRGEEEGEWAMDTKAVNTNYASTTNIDDILHLEYGNWSVFNPQPENIWHLEDLSVSGTGSGSTATGKLYNDSGTKTYIKLQNSSNPILTTNSSDSYISLSFSSNNASGSASNFDIYKSSAYLAPDTYDDKPVYKVGTEGYSAYIYQRENIAYKTTPACPKYTVTWKVNGATVRTDYVSQCDGVPTPPTAPADNTLSCATAFVGWSDTDLGHEDGNDKPSVLFKFASEAPELTTDKTFYAVFGTFDGYEYVGDAESIYQGEKYLFINGTSTGTCKAITASGLSLQSGSTVTNSGTDVTVVSGPKIEAENTNLEFYCSYQSPDSSVLQVVANPTRWLYIDDKGIGYKVNSARSHYKNHTLYGWDDDGYYAYVKYDSGFKYYGYSANIYAFKKVYTDFKTSCYPEWSATVVEWGQNKVIIDVDASTAAKYDAQIDATSTNKQALTQTRTAYKGSASPKTYTIDGSSKFNFTTNAGDVLVVNWYNGSDEEIAYSHIQIPTIIAANTTLASNMDEVHVLPGATLTVSSSYDIEQLEVYPGATVYISGSGVTLTADKFIIRGGWSRINSTRYDVGRVDISPYSSLSKSHAYMDWYLDYDLYYPIGVPFPVTMSDAIYKNDPNVKVSDGVKMRYYDGASRAAGTGSAGDGDNWKMYSVDGKAYPASLEPSHGYAMTAKRPGGKAFSVIRMPLSFTNTWTTGGEKGVVDGSRKNAVSVTKYYTEDVSQWYSTGWNFIANPYMTLFNGGGKFSGILEAQDGGEVRFATIPTEDFKDYYQVNISEAELRPGCGFFIQAGGVNNAVTEIVFASDGRKHMPARLMPGTMSDQEAYIRLTGADAKDQMGVIVGEAYSEAYDDNADLAKIMSSDNSLKSYLRYAGMDLAYVALNPALAKEWIPVIVRIPAAGDYTYSLTGSSKVDALEAIWLNDSQTGIKTDLLTDPYTFHSDVTGTISDRFYINAIIAPRENPTDIGNLIDEKAEKPVKFMFNNNIYIRYQGAIYDSTGKRVMEINK